MTARTKINLLVAALICANLAVWGARQVLAGAFDPIIRSLGG